jgi:hypothetical protein
VNNAVARTGGLLAVAVLPVVAGISGAAYQDPPAFRAGFQVAMTVCAGLLLAGGLVAAATIRNRRPGPAAAVPARRLHCAVDGPPIHAAAAEASR